MEGAHRLMMSILLAISTTPKTALSSFPILSSLGSVTDQLQTLCGWEASVMAKIKELHKIRDGKVRDSGLVQLFFSRLDTSGPASKSSTPTKPTLYLGRYYRLMLSDFTGANLPETFWKSEVTDEEIRMARKLFNKRDSDVAIITSELLDLNVTAQSLAPDSNLNVDGMSEPDSHFSALDSFRDLESFLGKDSLTQEQLLEANISAERVRWSTQVIFTTVFTGRMD